MKKRNAMIRGLGMLVMVPVSSHLQGVARITRAAAEV